MPMLRYLAALLLAILPLHAADVFEQQRRLGRGLNMGNSLEAPKGALWGRPIADEDFPRIKAAGFASVRIPVRWADYAAKDAPYAIDPEFCARVEHLVRAALKADLQVILNVHHFDELDQDPVGQRPRFAGIWKQLAVRFADFPDALQFELCNEPHGKQNAAEWNANLLVALKEIRSLHPTRAVHVGPVQWNQIQMLKELKLPSDDRHLIAHVHYYSPFHFTHKNASWVKGSKEWKDGDSWDATPAEKTAIEKDFAVARDWAKAEGRPVFLGEFGACGTNPNLPARVRWTRFVRDTAEAQGFSWTYWEYQAGFGVWDPQAKAWRKDLLESLVGK
jgi:endoglucanase